MVFTYCAQKFGGAWDFEKVSDAQVHAYVKHPVLYSVYRLLQPKGLTRLEVLLMSGAMTISGLHTLQAIDHIQGILKK